MKPNKNKINNKSWSSEQFVGPGVLSDTLKFIDVSPVQTCGRCMGIDWRKL